ncbi:hypothetical protein [Poseidonibacter ostreae]|uniref:Uncharacterized protein n=1 Tax=Poseidonibacter ostreae TaxID=2654171 RepID=A0A6L4WY53_9BACT|nr:hypothetical protein [Poseidonibacter ostreae]KAB7891400.1 hypothetical protein GBG19_00760 [Poseidonibacter ostreae]
MNKNVLFKDVISVLIFVGGFGLFVNFDSFDYLVKNLNGLLECLEASFTIVYVSILFTVSLSTTRLSNRYFDYAEKRDKKRAHQLLIEKHASNY